MDEEKNIKLVNIDKGTREANDPKELGRLLISRKTLENNGKYVKITLTSGVEQEGFLSVLTSHVISLENTNFIQHINLIYIKDIQSAES